MNEYMKEFYKDEIEKGKIELLISLVKDKLISIAEAAKRANMTESAFSALVH